MGAHEIEETGTIVEAVVVETTHSSNTPRHQVLFLSRVFKTAYHTT